MIVIAILVGGAVLAAVACFVFAPSYPPVKSSATLRDEIVQEMERDK